MKRCVMHSARWLSRQAARWKRGAPLPSFPGIDLVRCGNHASLLKLGPEVLAASDRMNAAAAVLVVDIDCFRSINASFGRMVGDQLLREVARRITTVLRDGTLLARTEGDRFVLVVPGLKGPSGALRKAKAVHAVFNQPVVLADEPVDVTASIGVALYPRNGVDLEQLLGLAGTAMEQAKRAGRAHTRFYAEPLGPAAQRRMSLERALREACQGHGLSLHFQPQIQFGEQPELCGAEALMRWSHPVLGSVAPNEFIALAEHTGLIIPLGRWAIDRAALHAAAWNDGQARPVRIAVNVSACQLGEQGFTEWVEQTLKARGCRPEWIKLEVTESVFAAKSQRLRRCLVRLRAIGLFISLDDFGTGFSALNYLARFPVDELKIDRSFVNAIDQSERNNALVRAFAAMAKALDLSVVAEGVETAEQAVFLQQAGCSRMQGWHFGHGVPAHEFERTWLAPHRAAPCHALLAIPTARAMS